MRRIVLLLNRINGQEGRHSGLSSLMWLAVSQEPWYCNWCLYATVNQFGNPQSVLL